MTEYIIYTDAQGRVFQYFTNCDTSDDMSTYTRTLQQDGTPPVVDPVYAPAPPAPSPSLQDQITAIISQLTTAQQTGIQTALAGATTATPTTGANPVKATV